MIFRPGYLDHPSPSVLRLVTVLRSGIVAGRSLYSSLVDLMSIAVASVAKAILSQMGKEFSAGAARGARTLVLGDPEQKALERALGRAFTEVGKAHGDRLANFDINVGFWEHEGAAELAKVLVTGLTPSAARLAERAVDSLGRSRSGRNLPAMSP